MDVADAFLGLMIILLVGWLSFMQLWLTDVSNTVAQVGMQQSAQTIAFSSPVHCPPKEGMRLVPEEELAAGEYTFTANAVNGTRVLCFYEKEKTPGIS